MGVKLLYYCLLCFFVAGVSKESRSNFFTALTFTDICTGYNSLAVLLLKARAVASSPVFALEVIFLFRDPPRECLLVVHHDHSNDVVAQARRLLGEKALQQLRCGIPHFVKLNFGIGVGQFCCRVVFALEQEKATPRQQHHDISIRRLRGVEQDDRMIVAWVRFVGTVVSPNRAMRLWRCDERRSTPAPNREPCLGLPRRFQRTQG